jgi:hypothetical protein
MANNVNKIEALVDAISHLCGSGNPDSDCYKIRNPLLIRSFARPGKHLIDDQGRRIFPSWLAGYKAACYDVDLKVRGQSRAGLKPTDTLTNLLGVYGLNNNLATGKVVNFLKRALADQAISAHTPLSYFISTDSVQEGQ